MTTPHDPVEDALASLQQLRTLLIELYMDPNVARILASDAGVPLANVDMRGAPGVFWHEILVAAHHHDRLHAVVERAASAFPPRRGELEEALLRIGARRGSPIPRPEMPTLDERVHVLVATALDEELGAVLEVGEWSETRAPDGFQYWVRMVGPLRVAVTCAMTVGPMSVAARAASLMSHLKPPVIVMCGVCTGRKGAVRPGDVIIANEAYRYAHDKLTAFTRDPRGTTDHGVEMTYRIRSRWASRIASAMKDRSWHSEVVRYRPIALVDQCDWLLLTLLQGDNPANHPQRRERCPDWDAALQYARRHKLVESTNVGVFLTIAGQIRVRELNMRHPDGLPRPRDFEVHVGPVAVGDAIQGDAKFFEKLARAGYETLGAELGKVANGFVADYADVASLVIKAAVIPGEERRHESRKVACRTSANFLLWFLRREADWIQASSGLDLQAPASGRHVQVYRCKLNPCRLGFHRPFADGTDRADQFKRMSLLQSTWPMEDIKSCACGPGVMEAFNITRDGLSTLESPERSDRSDSVESTQTSAGSTKRVWAREVILYRCDQDPCRKGYHVPFADGTPRSRTFKQESRLPQSRPMAEVFSCVCGPGLIAAVPRKGRSESEDDVLKEWYGALMLVCDLSGSMGTPVRQVAGGFRSAFGSDRSEPSRWDFITDSIAQIFYDFSQSGNHYDRVLISVIRFGENCNTFRLKTPGGPAEGVRWFTIKTLAEAMGWRHHSETFNHEAIRDTVRNHLLPRHAVDGTGTRLAPALEEARNLAELVYSPPDHCPELPASFGGLEPMHDAPDLKTFWSFVYTDGMVDDEHRTLQAKDALQTTLPGMVRLTAFFGDRDDAFAATGGQLMMRIASTCTAGHTAPVPAYYTYEEFRRIRYILSLATHADRRGFCPRCLL